MEGKGVNRRTGLALRSSRGLALVVAWGLWHPSAHASEDAQVAADAGVHDATVAHHGRDALPENTVLPAPGPSGNEAPASGEPAAELAQAAVLEGADAPAFSLGRRKAKSRLTGLAAMTARIASQTKLGASGTLEAPRDMGTPDEHRIVPRRSGPEAAPPAAKIEALDQNIVKEIAQRKIMFRLCYESALKRSVNVTRADVRWILSPDGSVRDVVVEVEQDERLAKCIRAVASRSFSTTVPQEIPVSIPLVFVVEE